MLSWVNLNRRYGNTSNPDLLTEVDYPDRTWLKFSYNVVGQRTQSVDQIGFTLNSDTPYGSAALDLRQGPMVIEMPPGPFIGLVNDHYQGWILDMGLPGPDGDRGGNQPAVLGAQGGGEERHGEHRFQPSDHSWCIHDYTL